MPNIATTLKAEIARIARKELNSEVGQLRKQASAHRSQIAALKRRLDAAERQLRSTSRVRAATETSAASEDESGLRFRAAGLASHRKRLGLSAREAGLLLGVSPLTVYKWEGGSTRPRRTQLERIAAFRKLGKRQASAIVEQIGSQ